MATAVFAVKPTGARISAVVGSLSQPSADLVENIRSAFEALRVKLPGGVINIRSLYLASGKSDVQLPIYVSLLSANFVTLPPPPDSVKTEVTDELTTLDPELFGDHITKVKVRRDGRVALMTNEGVEVVEAKKKKRQIGKPLGRKSKKAKLTKMGSPTKAEVC